MTSYKISLGSQGVEFLERESTTVYGYETVARIVNVGGKGKWFATPATWIDGVLRNTDEAVQVECSRLRNQSGGAAKIAEALGL